MQIAERPSAIAQQRCAARGQERPKNLFAHPCALLTLVRRNGGRLIRQHGAVRTALRLMRPHAMTSLMMDIVLCESKTEAAAATAPDSELAMQMEMGRWYAPLDRPAGRACIMHGRHLHFNASARVIVNTHIYIYIYIRGLSSLSVCLRRVPYIINCIHTRDTQHDTRVMR